MGYSMGSSYTFLHSSVHKQAKIAVKPACKSSSIVRYNLNSTKPSNMHQMLLEYELLPLHKILFETVLIKYAHYSLVILKTIVLSL